MRIKVLNELQSFADEDYRKFTVKLLPKNTSLIGVRTPILRRIIKRLQKEGKAEAYLTLSPAEFEYNEEMLVYAGLLAQLKTDFTGKSEQVKNFVPHINNWAVCDMFCADFKEIKQNPHVWFDGFLFFTKTGAEYQIRFFYVIALNYFISSVFLPQLFALIAKQTYVGFYDKMAVAWFLSVAYVHYPKETERFLLDTPIDSFVFNKTISKICDSFRVTKEAKTRLRALASLKKDKN